MTDEAGVITRRPDGWDVRPLLSLVSLPVGQVDPRLEPYRSMILAAPDHVESGTGRLLDRVTARDQGAISGKYVVSVGDVVYSKIRPNLRKAFLADFSGLCSADMYPLRARPGVSPGFVLATLLSEPFVRYAVSSSARSGIPKINREELAGFVALVPPADEQRAIAQALFDVDSLIRGLDELIVKMRNMRQGAVQQLLSGRNRLPGFTKEWRTTTLGEIARIKTGDKNNDDKVKDGRYPFFVRSQTVERIDTYSYDGEAILVPGEGGIGTILHYVEGKFDYHQRVYKVGDFVDGVSAKFVYYYMAASFHEHAVRNSVKAAVDSLRLPAFKSFEISLPELDEQKAIAATLSDIDAEIGACSARRNKVSELATGFAQALLAGRVRLFSTEPGGAAA